VSTDDLEITREQLLKLLRISPKLTTVVARDPTLLADEQYVSRNNPALEQFLQTHPEIVRNPDFYLFANFGNGKKFSRDMRLEAAIWPELTQRRPNSLGPDVLAFLAFLCILFSLLWLIRVLLENRRWTQVFKQQSQSQNKLFDAFGSGEELLKYVQSGSGTNLLEPIPTLASLGPGSRGNTPLARVLTPLQFGIVSTLVGLGFLWLAAKDVGDPTPLTIFGILLLMLGVGLIISAVVSWAIGKHFGLLPAKVGSPLESPGVTRSGE